jgi:hypothetical protein
MRPVAEVAPGAEVMAVEAVGRREQVARPAFRRNRVGLL